MQNRYGKVLWGQLRSEAILSHVANEKSNAPLLSLSWLQSTALLKSVYTVSNEDPIEAGTGKWGPIQGLAKGFMFYLCEM